MRLINLYTIILSFVFYSNHITAQCCPYITGIEITPQPATPNDSVYIVTIVYTPNLGNLISSEYIISQDTIYVNACYFNGILTQPLQIKDTLNIGVLNEGNYTVKFTAYSSGDPYTCVNYDSQQLTKDFVVSASNSISEINTISSIYPNPFTHHLFIKSNNGIDKIEIVSLDGKVTQIAFNKNDEIYNINTFELTNGVYFLTIFFENGSIRKEKLIKV